jgi:hypothetical protein
VEDLARMIPVVLAEAGTVDRTVSLLVVDNDPDESARPVVEGFADHGIRYIPQPESVYAEYARPTLPHRRPEGSPGS